MTPCTSTDPISGAVCQFQHNHVGRHGGMDTRGDWRHW